jgi:hypothetical protein
MSFADQKNRREGLDAAQQIQGRKRCLPVENNGRLLQVEVHGADAQVRDGAKISYSALATCTVSSNVFFLAAAMQRDWWIELGTRPTSCWKSSAAQTSTLIAAATMLIKGPAHRRHGKVPSG